MIAAGLAGGPAWAQSPSGLPDYLADISGTTPPSPADLATKNVLQLNTSMFSLYENAGDDLPQQPAGQASGHPRPVLGRGRPDDPLSAGQAADGRTVGAARYQVQKSLGHSVMAISEVVMPYLNNAADKTWVAPMRAYLAEMKSALEGIDSADMDADWKPNSRAILENNIAFMEDCLAKGMISMDALQAFAKKQGPFLKLAINWAASTQVKHWMDVLDEWKARSAPTGTRPTARRTRSTWPARTTCCSAYWPSISAPRRSTTG